MAPTTVRLHPDPPLSGFVRALICHALGGGNAGAREIAAQHCKSTPQLAEFFGRGGFDRERTLAEEYRRKAGVAAGSIAGTNWLDDVSPYGIAAEGFLLLQSASIFGRLLPGFRRVPFRTTTPREFGAGAGSAWRGEGLPTPTMQTTVDQLLQNVYESSTIFSVTREVLAFGQIAETMLRGIVAAAVSKWIDGQLLDPSVTATSAHPASITNAAAAITSSGSTAAAILTDLAALVGAIQSPGDSLRFVMRPTTYTAMCAKLAGVGYNNPPGLLLNVPVVLGSTSPHQVALVDAASIVVSHDDSMTVDINATTSIQQDTAPTQSGVTGTGASLVSMFQTRSVAIKASLDVAWQVAAFNDGSPTQASGVAVLTNIDY